MSSDSPTPPAARWYDSVPLGFAWRYLTHSLMLGLAMANEMRAAPSLPDTILEWIPRSDLILRHNYHIWIVAYLPLAFWLWRVDRQRFVHFLYVGGVLSLIRGLCITLTGLGPVVGADVNAGMTLAEATNAWWALVNPVSALWGDAPHIYLTKDLFFSGHTATTFLLLLYTWSITPMRYVALFAHVLVVVTVFWSHLHYTIDVVGAWAITGCLYVLATRYFPWTSLRPSKRSLAE